MYLGYQYKNQLSILASRITLHLQKEIKLYFFDVITMDEDHLQGFTLSRYNLPKDIAKDMVKDLPCIFINEWNSTDEEICFIVCKSTDVINRWYKEKWEGFIASKVCRQFNWFDKPVDDDKVATYRKQMEEEYRHLFYQVV